MKIAVLVSGRGSNLKAIFEAIDRGVCSAQVVAVLADRSDAQALELARSRGVPTEVVSPKAYADRGEWDATLADAIARFEPRFVVLAGFMRIVGAKVLERFAGRIINVHPALLPAFPGMDGPAQAVKKGVTLSGCTVHIVDAGVDTGPILAQAAVPVLPSDDAASLHARIQVAEHTLLPAVIDAVARGDIELSERPRFVRDDVELPSAFYWPPVVRS